MRTIRFFCQVNQNGRRRHCAFIPLGGLDANDLLAFVGKLKRKQFLLLKMPSERSRMVISTQLLFHTYSNVNKTLKNYELGIKVLQSVPKKTGPA